MSGRADFAARAIGRSYMRIDSITLERRPRPYAHGFDRLRRRLTAGVYYAAANGGTERREAKAHVKEQHVWFRNSGKKKTGQKLSRN